MDALIPTHLQGHAVPVEVEFGRGFALRSAQGGDQFEIWYSGDLLEEYGLIVGGEAPSLVIAKAHDSGEEIVLFDAARHGYDAMFVDEPDLQAMSDRSADTLLERDGHTVFSVEIQLMDNIDWDDEEDDFRDAEGVLRLITGEAISEERLRADGFDALGITVKTAQGQRYDVVEEELA
ncbi:hypothetical protein GCM10027417_29020 [Glutamicibacter endophyticus]